MAGLPDFEKLLKDPSFTQSMATPVNCSLSCHDRPNWLSSA
jgi:hypothetical protein